MGVAPTADRLGDLGLRRELRRLRPGDDPVPACSSRRGWSGIWRRIQDWFLLWPFKQRRAAAERVTDATGGAEPLLAVEQLEVAYHRVVTAVQGVSLSVAQGSDRRAARHQRRRQDHDAARDLRASSASTTRASPRARIRYKGERIENRPPHRVTALGIVLVPERSKVFENLSVAENLEATVPRPRPRARPRGEWPTSVFEYFPRAGAAARARGGTALGRRAADAGDRLRARVRAGAAARRRAVARARAAGRRGADGVSAADPPDARHDRPARRAERAGRARCRRSRLRHGERPHRARRHARAPAGAPGHPRVLPRMRRRARAAAIATSSSTAAAGAGMAESGPRASSGCRWRSAACRCCDGVSFAVARRASCWR